MSNKQLALITFFFLLLRAFVQFLQRTRIHRAMKFFLLTRSFVWRARLRFIARYAKRCMKNAFINVFAARQQSKIVATDALDAATAVGHLTHSNNGATEQREKLSSASTQADFRQNFTLHNRNIYECEPANGEERSNKKSQQHKLSMKISTDKSALASGRGKT